MAFRLSSSIQRFAVLHSRAHSNTAVRAFATEAAPKKERTVEVPADKSTISPMRALFYGDLASYRKHCLPYPNALSADASDTLAQMVQPVSSFFAKVPSAQIDEKHSIPDEVMRGLAELGLFGLQIPVELGGLGLSNTAYARMAEEFVMDPSIAVTLMAHQSIGLKGIILFGTDAQKAKFLPPLASGEALAAFALTEPSTGSDAASIRLKATPTEDGKAFVLNGQKMWISNGGIAKTYTVFARTPAENGETKVTAFIVNRDESPGIIPGAPEKKLGIRGSNTCVVTFENCVVPRENVLGEVNGGFKVAMGILNNGRFGMGAASGGGIRKLIGMAAEYANNRVQFGKPISEFGLIREKFARMAIDAYACESMAYMTTALIDGPGIDMSIEAAICKIYGSEAMFNAINDCIQILGGMGFSAGGVYPFERLLRDSRILLIFEGTNEILRLFIALTCMQGPGAELQQLSKKLKNPAALLPELPTLLQRYLRTTYGIGAEAVPCDVTALQAEAAAVGKAVCKLQSAVQTLLIKHGKDVVNNQWQLQRVANIAIDLYGCVAVLSRVSKAVNDKLPSADHEVVLARAFINGALSRIGDNHKGVLAGNKKAGDADKNTIAADMLSAGKYLAEHPLRL